MPTRYRIQRITQPNGDISHWVVQRKGLFGWRDEKEAKSGDTETGMRLYYVTNRFYSEQDAHQYIKTQTRVQRGPVREVVWESPVAPKKEWSQGARMALWAGLSITSLCGTMLPVIPLAAFLLVGVSLVCFIVGLNQ